VTELYTTSEFLLSALAAGNEKQSVRSYVRPFVCPFVSTFH